MATTHKDIIIETTIKGNKTQNLSNACFISYNTLILNQNIITSLPISHPNTLSPIPTKLPNQFENLEEIS